MFYDCESCEATLELCDPTECPVCGGCLLPSVVWDTPVTGVFLNDDGDNDVASTFRDYWQSEGDTWRNSAVRHVQP